MSASLRSHRASAALCAVAASAALALTACGPTDSHSSVAADSSKSSGAHAGSSSASPEPFAGESGPDVVNKALKTTRTAKSLRFEADVQDPTEGHILLDMSLSTAGACSGTVGIAGGSADVVKTGGTLYMKFDKKLLLAEAGSSSTADQNAAVAQMANRWFKTPTSSVDAKDFVTFCDLDGLLKQFTGDDTVARKGSATTVDGTPALSLTEHDAKDSYTFAVATHGAPYLLRMVAKGSDSPGTVTLSEFDKPVDAKAPDSHDIEDLSKLGG
jgi:hypothetical protein